MAVECITIRANAASGGVITLTEAKDFVQLNVRGGTGDGVFWVRPVKAGTAVPSAPSGNPAPAVGTPAPGWYPAESGIPLGLGADDNVGARSIGKGQTKYIAWWCETGTAVDLAVSAR